jgi:hypothetical protein
MAVSIPSGIYSLGAVQFNAQPLAALEGQLLAKRAAKEQALDDALEKYNQDKINRTTTTGMASNDLDAFTKMYKDIQSYYSQNKDRIARNPSLKYEYNNKWRNLENLVSESKGKVDEAKQPEGLLYTSDFRQNGNPDELIKDVHAHNEPLYIQDASGNLVRNPNRKRFEYNENIYFPKKMDYNKIFDEYSKGFKGDTELGVVEGSEKLPENKRNFQYDVIKGHGKDAVTGIIENAFNGISQDRGYMSSLQQEVKKASPKELSYIWDKYTKNYHPDIEPDDPRSLLIGKLAEQAELRQFKAKKTDERQKAAYGSALIEGRQKTSPGGTNLIDYDLLGDYANRPNVTSTISFPDILQPSKKITRTIIPYNNISVEDRKIITSNDAVEPYTDKATKQKYFIIRDNGDWEGSGGQLIDRTSVARANLDKTSLSEEKRIRQGALNPSGKNLKYVGLDAQGNPVFK